MARYETDGVKIGRSRYGSISNSFDEGKISRDEGGRFAIGATKSGKAVYSKFEDPDHAGFDAADHSDAANLHRDLRDKHGSAAIDHFDTPEMDEHYKKSGYHGAEAQKHTRAELYGKKGPPKPRGEKGANTPGKIGKKDRGGDMTHEEIRAGEDKKKAAAFKKSAKAFGVKA